MHNAELKLYERLNSQFSPYANSVYSKELTPTQLAKDLLKIIKEETGIYTFADSDETILIVNNREYQAESYLRKFIAFSLDAMNVQKTTHFYNEVIQRIKIDTYVDRAEFYAEWENYIAFKNHKYLDLQRFELVKPSIELFRKLVEFLGVGYNTKIDYIAHILERYENSPEDFAKVLNNDEEHTVKEGIAMIGNIDLVYDFPKLMGFLPIKRINVAFDPKAKCPTFINFIKTSVPPQFRKTLQRFAGYCLLPTNRYQKFLVLVGGGSNGKTTFIEVLKEIFKGHVSSLSMQEIVENRFATSYLEGKLVNIYDDLPPRRLISSGNLKRLVTNEEKITVERKFRMPHEAKITTKFIFTANRIPASSDDSYAFFRRFLIVDFPRQFSLEDGTADPHLLDKLKKELSGILNWVIAGAYHLVQSEKNHFAYELSDEELERKYYRASDPVAAFAQDCLRKSIDDNYWISKSEVYQAFLKYCEVEGLPTLSQASFTKRLKRYLGVQDYRPVDPVTGKRVDAFLGITFSDDCADGEYVGKKQSFDWGGENDEYIPEPLPPSLGGEVKEYEKAQREEKEKQQEDENKIVTVRALQNFKVALPEKDLECFKEDVLTLPEKVAKILERKGYVEIIKI